MSSWLKKSFFSTILVLMVVGVSMASGTWLTFAPGQVVKASEINQNFQTARQALQDAAPKELANTNDTWNASQASTPQMLLEFETAEIATNFSPEDVYFLRMESGGVVVAVERCVGPFTYRKLSYSYNGSGPDPATDTFTVGIYQGPDFGELTSTVNHGKWSLRKF